MRKPTMDEILAGNDMLDCLDYGTMNRHAKRIEALVWAKVRGDATPEEVEELRKLVSQEARPWCREEALSLVEKAGQMPR